MDKYVIGKLMKRIDKLEDENKELNNKINKHIGWECPKCGNCYCLTKAECDNCNSGGTMYFSTGATLATNSYSDIELGSDNVSQIKVLKEEPMPF